jgi:AbrB family looped-hinge helix DNA binding protein
MLTNVRRLTKKGQVTIPKKIRDKLKSEAVVFEILDDQVIIKPVRSVAGALQKYAKTLFPFKEAREKAWEEVAHERSRKRPVRR